MKKTLTPEEAAAAVRANFERAHKELEGIDRKMEIFQIVERYESKLGIHYAGPITARLSDLFLNLESKAVDAVAGLSQFKEDLLIYLRALTLTLEMAGNASTHKEKDARLRGTVEILEQMIARLQNETFELCLNRRYMSDFMRADWPTRAFKERIYELEKQLAEHQPQTANQVTAEPYSNEQNVPR